MLQNVQAVMAVGMRGRRDLAPPKRVGAISTFYGPRSRKIFALTPSLSSLLFSSSPPPLSTSAIRIPPPIPIPDHISLRTREWPQPGPLVRAARAASPCFASVAS